MASLTINSTYSRVTIDFGDNAGEEYLSVGPLPEKKCLNKFDLCIHLNSDHIAITSVTDSFAYYFDVEDGGNFLGVLSIDGATPASLEDLFDKLMSALKINTSRLVISEFDNATFSGLISEVETYIASSTKEFVSVSYFGVATGLSITDDFYAVITEYN